MIPRRAQTPIAFRSNKAAALLAQHARTGRSQAEIIEDALERLPIAEEVELTPDQAARMARIQAIIDSIPPNSIMSMKEFDALEYDEFGDLR